MDEHMATTLGNLRRDVGDRRAHDAIDAELGYYY